MKCKCKLIKRQHLHLP